MQKIDVRIKKETINKFINNTFTKYKLDKFVFTNSVTGNIALYIGNEIYLLTNIQEEIDYFGVKEDDAILRLAKCEESDVHSYLDNIEQISMPVEEKIKSIVLVNEDQKIYSNNELVHEVLLTRSIIIRTENKEIMFIKDYVPFSEEIIVQKGHNLIDKVEENEEFKEAWDKYKTECKNEIIIVE